MTTISHDGLSVCVDCAMILANGTVGNEDEREDQEHAARMDAQWAGVTGDMVLACEDECEESFSWRACDGCGTTLGGNRHPAVVFAAGE